MSQFPKSHLWFLVPVLLVVSMLSACVMLPPVPAPFPPAATPVAETPQVPESQPTPATQNTPEAQQVSSAAPEAVNLEGTPWQLQSYADSGGELTAVLPGTEVTVEFQGGALAGNAGCNDYTASYQTDGNSLRIGQAAVTQKFCADPTGIMDQEGRYLALLGMASSYQIKDGRLEIADGDRATVLIYAGVAQIPMPPASISGRTWQATLYNNGKGGLVTPLAGTELTAVFGEDGIVSGSTSCNNYSASYELNGNAITIGPAATTRMICVEPEGIMEQEASYLAALGTATTYRIVGRDLELLTADGIRAITYVPKAELAVAVANALANLEYKSEFTQGGTAQLTNGEYREPSAPDSAAETVVRLTNQIAFGTLNGQPALAVVLVTDPGGSGTFYDLAVVVNQDGQLVNVATTSLGDRVIINSIAIEDNEIVVDMVTQGPNDPMCCPTEQVIETFALQGDQLVQTTPAPAGPAVPPAAEPTLVGVTWQWQDSALSDGSFITVTEPSKYTLEFRPDNTVAIQADCNSGSGTYKSEGDSLSIEITVMTLAACPPGSFSDQYVLQLNSAASYSISAYDLIINLANDAGNMHFSLAPAGAGMAAAPVGTPLPTVTLDTQGLAANVQAQEVPAAPYDKSQPPGPTGAPAHLVVLLDDQEVARVLPVEEYVALWQAAGDDTIALNLEQLKALLAERPASPQAPLPILPPPAAYNDLATQVKYLDFADGTGIAFVGRVSQDASPILNYQLKYYFVGLTGDGKYLVSLQYPVSTAALSDAIESMPEEQKRLADEDFTAYLQQTIETLNALAPGDFEPDLSKLDAMVNSLTIEVPGQASAEQPTAEPTAVVTPESAAQPSAQLVGSLWSWIGTAYSNDTTVAPEDPAQYTLEFLPDGQFLLKADCNSAAGTYTQSDGGLKIEVAASTMTECGPDSLSGKFVADLDAAAAYTVQGQNLFVDLFADAGTMKFNPLR
jgi:heat shock protein HslJ